MSHDTCVRIYTDTCATDFVKTYAHKLLIEDEENNHLLASIVEDQRRTELCHGSDNRRHSDFLAISVYDDGLGGYDHDTAPEWTMDDVVCVCIVTDRKIYLSRTHTERPNGRHIRMENLAMAIHQSLPFEEGDTVFGVIGPRELVDCMCGLVGASPTPRLSHDCACYAIHAATVEDITPSPWSEDNVIEIKLVHPLPTDQDGHNHMIHEYGNDIDHIIRKLMDETYNIKNCPDVDAVVRITRKRPAGEIAVIIAEDTISGTRDIVGLVAVTGHGVRSTRIGCFYLDPDIRGHGLEAFILAQFARAILTSHNTSVSTTDPTRFAYIYDCDPSGSMAATCEEVGMRYTTHTRMVDFITPTNQ